MDGFLGTRASWMLDFVVLAMFGVLPILGYSIWLVKARQAYLWHKRIQLTLAIVLGVTVLLFERDMRMNGWTDRAAASPYYGSSESAGLVYPVLYLHLCFSVTTAILWIGVVVQALRKFPTPPGPGPHSAGHKRWGWIAAIDLALTALTGWIFYWVAFVATAPPVGG